MKNKLKNVKVGQKVYSITYGSGRVNKLLENVFTVEFGYKSVGSVSKKIKVFFEEQSFKYNGAIWDSAKNNQEVFLKKPVTITKKRLNWMISKEKRESYVDGQHSGYREARRILKLEFEEELDKRIKEALESNGLDPNTKVTLKGYPIDFLFKNM